MIQPQYNCLVSLCPVLAFCVLAFCIFTGCVSDLLAPSTEKISGKITLEGAPLAGATIMLIPLNTTNGRNQFNPLSIGKTGPDGEYSLKTPDGRIGAARGLHLVLISKPKASTLPLLESAKPVNGGNEFPSLPDTGSALHDSLQQLAAPWMVAGHPDKNEMVPSHYNRESILTAIVEKGGITKLDFDLKLVDPWASQPQSGENDRSDRP